MNTDNNPLQQYINGVLDGSIVTNTWVKLSVKRHLNDITKSKTDTYPYYFNEEYGLAVCGLFPIYFKHFKGPLANQPFRLEGWEYFIVASLFGWLRKKDDLRRFRRTFITVARKNGKSSLMAGIALIMMLFDDEPTARVYCAAVSKDQTKEVAEAVRQFIVKNPELRKRLSIYHNRIYDTKSNSEFQALASESNSLEGLDVHCAIVDEVAFHPSDRVYQVLKTALANRLQPLICCITTAGFNQSGFAYQLQKNMEDVLNGTVDLEEWFTVIYSLDESDSFSDEKVWIKANPNLYHNPAMLDEIRSQCKDAVTTPSDMTNFLIKAMNIWVSAESNWLSVDEWDKCKSQESFDYDFLKGKTCFAGLDYAETVDLTSLCLCFPPQNGLNQYHYIWKFYISQNTVDKHIEKGDFRWKEWAKTGELTVTPGKLTDQEYMRDDLKQWSTDFDLQMCGYDKKLVQNFASRLESEGIIMVEIPQTMMGLTEATKVFQSQIISEQLVHYGGSLIRWNINNVTLMSNNQGLCMPKRPEMKSRTRKVDGVLAAVTALACVLRTAPQTTEYESGMFL